MANGENPKIRRTDYPQQNPNLGWLYVYVLVFILCAVFFQLRSSKPPWVDGSPVEYFTASLLWMLSLTCLLIALENLNANGKVIFWLGSSVALAILAMDEIFGFHERSKNLVGDDDYIKILLFLMAGGVLYFLCRLEEAPLPVIRILSLGYLVQILWILDDMGDGDFYRLPFSLHTLRYCEEFLELLSMAVYLLGFQVLYCQIRERGKVAIRSAESK